MKKIAFLICLVFLAHVCCYSQDIYVYGNIKQVDSDYIKSLIKVINQRFKPKSIGLHYEKLPTFIYQHKDVNSEVLLEAQLELMSSSTQIIRHTAKEINQIKMNIIAETESKKKLIIFNNKGENIPSKSYNDNSELFDYINELNRKDKNFVVLLIFNKDRPAISIKTPKENQKTSKPQIEGIASSADTISQVLVRVNNKEWVLVSGLTNWATKTSLLPSNNIIEAMAIDKLQDTSEVFKITNVSYEAPIRNQYDINYIYPSETQNVVPRCMLGGEGYDYSFKISYEPTVELSSLQLVIEDQDHKVIYSEALDQLSENSKREIPKNNNTELCLFLPYSILNVREACAIDKLQNYYYSLRSTYGEKINFPPSIKIHFESFNQTPGSYDFCNCD